MHSLMKLQLWPACVYDEFPVNLNPNNIHIPEPKQSKKAKLKNKKQKQLQEEKTNQNKSTEYLASIKPTVSVDAKKNKDKDLNLTFENQCCFQKAHMTWGLRRVYLSIYFACICVGFLKNFSLDREFPHNSLVV